MIRETFHKFKSKRSMWYVPRLLRWQIPVDVVDACLSKVTGRSACMSFAKLLPTGAPICVGCAADSLACTHGCWYQITATGCTQACCRPNVATCAKSARIASYAITAHLSHKGLLLSTWVANLLLLLLLPLPLPLVEPVNIQFGARVTQV